MKWTPRTDALLHSDSPVLENEVWNLARQLERENAALKADAERYRYLRSIERRQCLTMSGPEAGVWCDCEDGEGNLILLTEDDLDAAIDAAKEKK